MGEAQVVSPTPTLGKGPWGLGLYPKLSSGGEVRITPTPELFRCPRSWRHPFHGGMGGTERYSLGCLELDNKLNGRSSGEITDHAIRKVGEVPQKLV